VHFKKAFDIVEHSTILEKHGIPRELDKVGQRNNLLWYLLDGVPGRKFARKRVVRHGDPMTPLLHVIIGYLLWCIINKSYRNGILSTHFPLNEEVDYHLSLLCLFSHGFQLRSTPMVLSS
jgi:hypothetical protein